MARKLTVWLGGLALLLTVVALVGCAVSTSISPVALAKHPGYTAGTSCDSTGCHDTYEHEKPYLGPCENCHTLDTWKPAAYSHKDTTFDNGMHPLIGCAMCHTEGEPLPAGGCVSCHDAPHAESPKCANCHTTTAWGMRKALPTTHVSLLGGHKALECFDCHTAKTSSVKTRLCVDCHGSNHGGLRNCQDCHDPATGWEPKDGWEHDSFFRITGQHTKLDCTDCHKNGEFAGTPKVCVGCHGKEHGGLTDCASCHTTAGFGSSTFKHSSVFPLTGLHKTAVKCTDCHTVSVDKVISFAKVLGNGSHRCVDCHGSQHGGLTACASCHTTAGFTAAQHPATFPLTGAHGGSGGPVCSDCHGTDGFTHPSTRCVTCHSTSSPHGTGITECQNCHTPTTWSNVAPGVHPAHTIGTPPRPCTDCHAGNDFSAPVPCANCHTAPHVAPVTCRSCHVPTGWSTVTFSHPQINGFGATGVHQSDEFGPYPAGCANCHPGTGTNPNFAAYSCTAAGCHQ